MEEWIDGNSLVFHRTPSHSPLRGWCQKGEDVRGYTGYGRGKRVEEKRVGEGGGGEGGELEGEKKRTYLRDFQDDEINGDTAGK